MHKNSIALAMIARTNLAQNAINLYLSFHVVLKINTERISGSVMYLVF